MTKLMDKTQYCWRVNALAEECEGPFDSEKEAFDDGQAEMVAEGYAFDDAVPVVELAVYPDPGVYAERAIDIGFLLDEMMTEAEEAEFYEGGGFVLLPGKFVEATEDLRKFLRGWGRKYVEAELFTGKDMP